MSFDILKKSAIAEIKSKRGGASRPRGITFRGIMSRKNSA